MRVCWPQHRRKITAVILAALFACILVIVYHTVYAATRTISPIGDIQADWSAQGDCSGQPLYECTNDSPNSPNTGAFARANGNNDVTRLLMDPFDIERGATSMTVRFYVRNFNQESTADDIRVSLMTPNGETDRVDIAITNSAWQWREVTFTNAISQDGANNLSVRMEQIRRRCALCIVGGVDTIDVATVYVSIDYDPYPELNQSAYRFYQNTPALEPGSPVADTNETGEPPGKGEQFRLRLLATSNTNTFIDNEFNYSLQVGEKVTTCSAASFTDVTTNEGSIRFYDNPELTDGSEVVTDGDDPDAGNPVTAQAYVESNPFTGLNNAAQGNDLLWDFSLVDADSNPSDEFCFRVVYEDGSELDTYSHYPVIRTVGDLSLSIINSGGELVSSPGFTMSPTVVLTECQSVTGTLGVSEQRLHITNDLVTEGWGVSIAATDGPSALWSAGTLQYDFNDPAGSPAGCAAGTDGDVYAGQMSIDPSTSTIEPSDGCSTTGVSAAPASAFEEGTNDIIGLVNASSTSERFCDFFVEGISIEQTIPPEQPMGNYSIDMTITIVAF